jgi:hypothetical protein
VTSGGPRPGAGRKPAPAGQRSVTITLRLPPDLAREIDAEAARYDTTRTAAIVARLRNGKALGGLP